jgi:hypothetical protein
MIRLTAAALAAMLAAGGAGAEEHHCFDPSVYDPACQTVQTVTGVEADATQPPLSEIFDAMAKGVMEPYNCYPSSNLSSCTYDGRGETEARQQASIYRAIAEVYRKWEGKR